MVTENRTVAFHTLGCKLNYAETSTIARKMEAEGFRKVSFTEAADIYVINTCSVTESADKECRTIVRRALRNSPDAKVVVIGCYAQLKPEEIAKIEGVDLVLGANEKFNLSHFIDKLPEEKKDKEAGVFYSCDINDVSFFQSSYSFGERTRAFLKIQDGCDYSCTYCTIPLARGKSRSDSIAHVVSQAEELATLGVKEIVLTGVNIGDFGIPPIVPAESAGKDTAEFHSQNSFQETLRGQKREETFFDLIRKLDKVEGIERFRISSIEPNLLKDEIIEWVAQSKLFMPHFHIPLQSGANEILKRMKRRYLRELYESRVAKIKSVMPHCCIGVDVIVGFPGETDELFRETHRFINSLDVSYLHVFTYSERKNTEASEMAETVPMDIRHERNKMLRILSLKKKNAFYEKHIGETRSVLYETEINDGMIDGYTDNYIKVRTVYSPELIGKTQDTKLNTLDGEEVTGVTEFSSHSISTEI